MAITRRDALKSLASTPLLPSSFQSGFQLQLEDPTIQAILEDPTIQAISEVVLPSECDRPAALRAFTRWIAEYREGADTDHGYGNTRVRATGPSPTRNYPAQIAALDAAARAAGAASFAAASIAQRRTIVEAAIAAAGVERLPARPTGAHIASDLMGHYLNSAAANDLCYRAAIGRDACRGLAGSDQAPAPRQK